MSDDDGHTISCSVPKRRRPGYGCPHCGKQLPRTGRELLLAAIIGLDCCGYLPSGFEAARWVLAGRFLVGSEERAWRRDERRMARRHRVPPSPR